MGPSGPRGRAGARPGFEWAWRRGRGRGGGGALGGRGKVQGWGRGPAQRGPGSQARRGVWAPGVQGSGSWRQYRGHSRVSALGARTGSGTRRRGAVLVGFARGGNGRVGEIQLTESPLRPRTLPRASLHPHQPHPHLRCHYRATAGVWPALGLNASPHGSSHSTQLWPPGVPRNSVLFP